MAALAVGAAGVLALHVRDPHRYGSWGLCPVKVLTGWDCPGCGALRAVNDLGNGHLEAAWHSNPLLLLTLPLLVAAWLGWTVRAARGRPPRLGPRRVAAGSAAYVVVVVAFALWRNTPSGAAFHVS